MVYLLVAILSCACPTHIFPCKLFLYPLYPLARASTGLLCAAAKTASLILNLDLTSFGWWPLFFKPEDMVNSQILDHLAMVYTFVKKPLPDPLQVTFFFFLQTPLFLTEKPFPSVYHRCCSSLDTFSAVPVSWTNNSDNNKTQMCAVYLWKGEGSPWKCFLSNNCSQSSNF